MTDRILRLRDVQPRPAFFTVWERHRHQKLHPLIECFAEFIGVFFYTYAGVGSTAGFVLGTILQESGVSSILQVGFAYACGIMFAITVCASTSGGHFNCAITICAMLFKGFPPLKGLRYIIAQILGGYVACLLVYAQYHDLFKVAEGILQAAGQFDALMFTPNGPAGVLALYVLPGSNLGRVFLNEFVCDTFIAMVIWACLDPTNILVPPAVLPFVISMAYAVAIWGYAVPGLAANAARDVGGRLAAISIYGTRASGGAYAALAALTNIPATIFGAMLYEFFLTDSERVMPKAQQEYLFVHKNHGHSPHAEDKVSGSDSSFDGKAHISHSDV